MPGTLTFSGARYPLSGEGDNIPADLLRFGSDLDDLVVLKASSEADRNARYADVREGTLVSCASLALVWQKVTTPPVAAAWIVIAQNSTAITTGVVTADAGWSVSQQYAKYFTGEVTVKAALNYNGTADIVAGSTDSSTPGGIADLKIGTLAVPKPPINWPVHARTTSASGTIILRYTDGGLIITDLATASKIRVGDFIEFAARYPV